MLYGHIIIAVPTSGNAQRATHMTAIQLQCDGPVARILIDNPSRRNAFSRAMWRAVPQAVAQAQATPGVHLLVLQSAVAGCFSAGDTFDDALSSVVEAINLHLEDMAEDGEDIQAPRPIAEHRLNADFDGGVWALVDVDVTRFDGHCEKVNITLPHRLLTKIDDYTRAHGRHYPRQGGPAQRQGWGRACCA